MAEKLLNENELIEVDGGYSPPEYDDNYCTLDPDYAYGTDSNDKGGPLV